MAQSSDYIHCGKGTRLSLGLIEMVLPVTYHLHPYCPLTASLQQMLLFSQKDQVLYPVYFIEWNKFDKSSHEFVCVVNSGLLNVHRFFLCNCKVPLQVSPQLIRKKLQSGLRWPSPQQNIQVLDDMNHGQMDLSLSRDLLEATTTTLVIMQLTICCLALRTTIVSLPILVGIWLDAYQLHIPSGTCGKRWGIDRFFSYNKSNNLLLCMKALLRWCKVKIDLSVSSIGHTPKPAILMPMSPRR